MKFQCDQCKNRYNIAEERVRGKILKIKCRVCSFVMTVSESSALGEDGSPLMGSAASTTAAAPANGSANKNGNSFTNALRSPAPPSGADEGPEQWYVAVDGEQFGPYSLAQSRAWIEKRQPAEVVHCWAEGFADWLPSGKVPQFSAIKQIGRSSKPSIPVPSAMAASLGTASSGSTLRPASALPASATMKASTAAITASSAATSPTGASTAQASTSLKSPSPGFSVGNGLGQEVGTVKPAALGSQALPSINSNPSPFGRNIPNTGKTPFEAVGSNNAAKSSALGRSPSEYSEPPPFTNDFEIAEASRVVNLSMLTARMPTPPLGMPMLPGMAPAQGDNRTGGFTKVLPIQTGEIAKVSPVQKVKSSLRTWAILGGIGAVLVAAIAAVLIMALQKSSEEEDALLRGKGSDDSLAYQYLDPEKRAKAIEEQKVKSAKQRTTRTTARSDISGSTGGGTAAGGNIGGASLGDMDESGIPGRGGAVGELTPDDVQPVYRTNQIAIQSCYNRALKKDPTLKLSKAMVMISVDTNGIVKSAKIPTLSGTDLGTCLETFIRRWKFPRNTSGLNVGFPVIFGN